METPANDSVDAFRKDTLALFSRIPAPPLYRRHDEPLASQCQTLVAECDSLLQRCRNWGASVGALSSAIAAHRGWLVAVTENRIEEAESGWRNALVIERGATAPYRLWKRADGEVSSAFNRATQASRYDAKDKVQLELTLACCECRKLSTYTVLSHRSSHDLTCQSCGRPFSVFVSVLSSLDVSNPTGRQRRYLFHLQPFDAPAKDIECFDSGREALAAKPGDGIALMFAPQSVLRAIINLDSGCVLWLASSGPCFVATVAFGYGAPELDVLRAFRDDVLLPTRLGRWLVQGYYRHGPTLAASVNRHRLIKRGIQLALRMWISRLERKKA